MNNFSDVFTTEDLRFMVWSLADILKTGSFSCPLEYFLCRMVYLKFFKCLNIRLEKNKKIYITEISEGT